LNREGIWHAIYGQISNCILHCVECLNLHLQSRKQIDKNLSRQLTPTPLNCILNATFQPVLMDDSESCELERSLWHEYTSNVQPLEIW